MINTQQQEKAKLLYDVIYPCKQIYLSNTNILPTVLSLQLNLSKTVWKQNMEYFFEHPGR